MMHELPADFYHLVCEQLAWRQDFGSLFNCALTSKLSCGPALMWLYRIHDKSAVITSEGNDANLAENYSFTDRQDAQRRTVANWALQWKSITRSSLGHTAYPYCLWIRSLDLGNLKDLLEDTRFREAAMDTFFADDMSGFLKSAETPMKQKMRGVKNTHKRIDIPYVLETIGESITSFVSKSAIESHSTVAMHDLSGDISRAALSRWVNRLPNLMSMSLWDGSNLNTDVGDGVANHCYKFEDLTIYSCYGDRADKDLAAFLGNLRSNTLRTFTVHSAGGVGPQSLLSLNNHSRSLKMLKLDGLKSDAIKHLSYLQGCDRLERLELTDADRAVDLEATENDIFLEVVAWLSKCENLRELLVKNIVGGTKIVTQVCLANAVKLKTLTVSGYPIANNVDFHSALAHQDALESLELRADPEDFFPTDIDALIAGISHLKKLKYLNLISTSDYFRTRHLVSLTSHLSDLEELWIGGYEVSDDLWEGLMHLNKLRSLNIHAITKFTPSGIREYILSLQPTNNGLLLSVMNQASESPITQAHQAILQRELTGKVDGRLEITMYREETESDSE